MNPKAQAIAEELRDEMKRPDPLPTQHLFGILESIRELEDMREEAAALGETAEEKAAQDAIAQYVSAQVVEKKVDGICAHIREWRTRNDALLAEASRLIELAKRYASRAESLEAATLNAMLAHGVTKISTDRNTLKTRQAGGVGALEVEDEATLPEAFRTATVTMSLHLLRSIMKDLSEVECREVYKTVTAADNAAIREALKERVQCPECKGTGDDERTVSSDAPAEICPRCNGDGTVQRTIPGVRIKERSMRLVME